MAEIIGDEALVSFLEGLGATRDQIEEAYRECRLARLPADLILTKNANLTAEDLASRAGVSVDEVVELWRTLGVAVPDAQRRMFSE
jgi:hypothetical protein